MNELISIVEAYAMFMRGVADLMEKHNFTMDEALEYVARKVQ